MKKEKALTLKTLNKSNVWDIQENDVFRLWEMAERDSDLKDNQRYYLQVVKSAFDIEEVKVDRPEVIKKLEERGYKIGTMRMDEEKKKWAVKKRPIMRLNDLTYENIHHISAAKLIEVHVAERRGDACALQRIDTEKPVCAVPHQPECQRA